MAASSLHISISGRFALEDLERLLSTLSPLVDLKRPASLTVDLRSLQQISATPLTVLVAVLAGAQARGLVAPESHMLPPLDSAVCGHVERMHLPQLLTAAELDLPKDPGPAAYVPCHQFVDGPGVEHVSRQLTAIADETFVDDPLARVRVLLAIQELAMNVLEHAASDVGGFAAAELDRQTLDFEVAFADCGVGVRASLARNPELRKTSSDLVALTTALKPGVSGTKQGAGMYLCLLEHAVQQNGGTMVLRSGTGELRASHGGQSTSAASRFPGTLVALRVSAARPFAPFDTQGIGA